MSVCISVTNLSLRGQYPVLDPRRTAGPGPFTYGYVLAADGLQIEIVRSSALSACEMGVNLATSLWEFKDILAWNLFSNTQVGRIGSPGLGVPSSMTIRKAASTGLNCSQGADSIVLRRKDNPFGWTAWYWFPPADFWDFWGGCTVTIRWLSDTVRGLWGDQIAAPSYPIVKLPDGTLMVDAAGKFSLVYGGTDFAISAGFLEGWGLSPRDAIPATPLPSVPADFTLVRELFTPDVFVVYGGAKFRMPDSATLFSLGFTWSQERLLPIGGAAKLRQMPIDGTLLREQHDPRVFLVENQKLRWVTSPAAMEGRCLPWRHVRTVPDNALGPLTKGADLGPP